MVEGHTDAPVLAVMPYDPGEGMMAWFFERMREVGIKRTDIRVVFVLEEPPKNTGGRASAAQIREAIPRAEKEVRESNPKVVLAMGRESLYLLTGLKEAIEQSRGYLIHHKHRGVLVREYREKIGEYKRASKVTGAQPGDPKMGTVRRPTPGFLPETYTGWVIPTYELYTIQASGFAIQPALKADIRRVSRALVGSLRVIDDEFTYEVSISPDTPDFDPGVIAVDIETTGVDNRTIDRVSISDGTRTFSLPWTEEVRVWLNRQMTLRHDWIVFHNGPFDKPRLKENGIDITPEMEAHCIFDSMYGGVIAIPDLLKGLGPMASVYLDLLPWKWPSLRDADPVKYSAKDAFVTARLFLHGLRPMLQQMRMWPLVTGRDYKWGPGVMATISTLSDMTEGGIKKDREYAMEWSKKLADELLGYLQTWTAMFPDVDPGSTAQMRDLFYRTWRLPVIRTKKDGVTTNEFAVMKSNLYIQSEFARTADRGPWRDDPRCKPETFDLLLNIREKSKLLGTYCTPILEGESDYVRPSYLPAAKDFDGSSQGSTATGRLASSGELNIQNQPHIARRIFIPDSPDWCFVQHDYQKAELWSMAAASGDSVMMDDLRGDPYQITADDAGTDRKTAKNVVLAGQYLAGPQKMSDMILKQQHFYVSPADCKRITSAITARWQFRTAYIRWLLAQCKAKGYLINPFGRVRVFHDRRGPAAVNFIPQSIVADILWCVLRDIAIYVRSLGGRLTTTVHDSILSQVPADRVPDCVRGVREIMQRRFDCVAPGFFLPVGCEVGAPGASWGNLQPV